jgi:hypothetical protein
MRVAVALLCLGCLLPSGISASEERETGPSVSEQPDFPMLPPSVAGDPLEAFRIEGLAGPVEGGTVSSSNYPGDSEWWWSEDSEQAHQKRLEIARERAGEVREARTYALFQAVLACDFLSVQELLRNGADPNAPLPRNPPREFLELLPPQLHYYATVEENFTPLMLAAALGYRDVAAVLIEGGADRWQKTKRHKTYALWLAAKTQDVELMRMLMNLDADREWDRYRVRVDLAAQKVFVFEGSTIVFESPVSTGKKSKPTAPGQYVVTDKHRNWTSTLYRVKMPYFMRLSCGDIGFHAGRLPGYPASSGCIRLPAAKAKELFQFIPIGTYVEIE